MLTKYGQLTPVWSWVYPKLEKAFDSPRVEERSFMSSPACRPPGNHFMSHAAAAGQHPGRGHSVTIYGRLAGGPRGAAAPQPAVRGGARPKKTCHTAKPKFLPSNRSTVTDNTSCIVVYVHLQQTNLPMQQQHRTQHAKLRAGPWARRTGVASGELLRRK